ncbi:gram-negative bacterial tonB protein [Variibacter gotjawalensis]|uniref:Gram-negative bacterial tonB protein n=1 Tax=Variibacter gotjawalensis TaxID=1333996 RepID=A0A0S3PZQ2_9BRAD|nr:TonB family protein [Variibacter gotjawalensis]NIK47256.1 protein TonB [Variibacter gotjawalensis]RZS49156.1 outer membrane transport energization protein TonB [Variibacter gotjawalensis]BAT61418.1 gram-negative bacterial tonB protein [Variibacter gotjawalensis]
MTDIDAHDSPRSREVFRWGACFACVLALHGGVAWALMNQEEAADVYEGNTLNLELAAMPDQVSPSNALASGEPQEAVEEQQAVHAEKPEEKVEKEDEKPPTEVPPSEDPQKYIAPLEAAEVTLPTAEPPKKVVETQQPVEERERREETARTSSMGNPQTPQWRARLAAHLQRFKRYPNDGARATGTTQIEFAVDRAGKLVHAKVLKGSGSDALDKAAIEMLRRAEPLPVPPSNIDEAQLKMLVPVKFTLPK